MQALKWKTGLHFMARALGTLCNSRHNYMHVSSSLLPLTNVEKGFLDGFRQFTQAQQRYIRCRLKKKHRLLNEQSSNVAAAVRERSNAAATIDLGDYNKSSAGSGNFVLSSFSGSPKRRSEDRISNPRVLSDMGLAIPRPTRFPPALTAGLGDPRTLDSVSEIIISFANPSPIGHVVGPVSNLLKCWLIEGCKCFSWITPLFVVAVVFGNACNKVTDVNS